VNEEVGIIIIMR